MQVTEQLREQLHQTIIIALAAYANDEDVDVQLTDAVIEVLSAIAEPTVKVFGKLPVKYIGKRPTYSDGNYETGDWVQGQSKMVSESVASQMLAHTDVYVAGESSETAELVNDPVKADDDPESEKLIDAKMAVQNMTRKAAVQTFVETNYNGMKIPDEFTTLSQMKDFAIRQIDIYALP